MRMGCRLLSAILSFIVVTATATAAVPLTQYAQMSSNRTQLPGIKGFAQVALDTLDEGQGISLDRVNNSLVINEEGTYFVMVAGQVGGREKQTEQGYVDLWLLKNGQPLTNSNTRQATGPNFTTVLVTQTVIHLKAQDAISFAFSATRPSLGLIATPATNSEPAIPSVIISVFKL